ncbi:hypothetical protein [Sulfitobacter sp. PS-8MA]|uniref:hypothetical protein n=1 Tax=Sulfitobacter sp. PS-8MA TaxID=3237707 RepID=UPI0034C5D66D
MNMKHAMAACVIGVLSIPTGTAANTFSRIDSKGKFLQLVADRKLVTDWGAIVIHSDGKISGQVGSEKLVGAWNWQGRFWCRNVRVGKRPEQGTDCQEIGISGNQAEFIRDQGRGESGLFHILD